MINFTSKEQLTTDVEIIRMIKNNPSVTLFFENKKQIFSLIVRLIIRLCRFD